MIRIIAAILSLLVTVPLTVVTAYFILPRIQRSPQEIIAFLIVFIPCAASWYQIYSLKLYRKEFIRPQKLWVAILCAVLMGLGGIAAMIFAMQGMTRSYALEWEWQLANIASTIGGLSLFAIIVLTKYKSKSGEMAEKIPASQSNSKPGKVAEQSPGPQNNKKMSKEKKDFKEYLTPKKLLIIIGAIVVICAGVLANDFNALRVVNITQTGQLDARTGKIIITYNNPIDMPLYKAASDDNTENQFYITSSLEKDRTVEVIRIQKPTRYHKTFTLEQARRKNQGSITSLFAPPETISVTTMVEQVRVERLVPAENSNPAPEVLENQIAIKFSGEIRGKYQTGVNIPVDEMEYVKLKNKASGYYRWVNDTMLTFNFTQEPPRYSTTYEFEVYPEKFINKDYQEWTGKRTSVQLTTSDNDVYITDFSLKDKVDWQAQLYITFSGNMVGALDVLKRKSQKVLPIKISPKAGGEWVWVNAKTIRFEPDSKLGWPVKNTVTVEVDPSINRQAERTWRENVPTRFQFYVAPREQSITSYNIHGESVALDKTLTVNFSRALKSNKKLRIKKSNAKITSQTPLVFTPHVDGEFYWTAPSVLKFKPKSLWPQLTKVKVALNPAFNPDKRFTWVGTKDFEFKTVENVVVPEFYFIPENRVSVTDFFENKSIYTLNPVSSPSLKAKTEQKLWILFDKKLGHHVSKSLKLSDAVKIEPSIEGKYRWVNSNILEFSPKSNWKGEEQYRIHLNKSLLYHPEQHFTKGRESYTFSTQKNTVEFSLKTEGKDDFESVKQIQLEPDHSLQIVFSKNMNTVLKVGKKYRLQDIDPQLLPIRVTPVEEIELEWRNKRELKLIPVKYWKPETEYKIELSSKILPQQESVFSKGEKIQLKTSKNLVMISSFSPTGRVGLRPVLNAVFNKNIKPDNVKIGQEDPQKLFKITPVLEGKWTWVSENAVQFKPLKPLAPSTGYSVEFNYKNIQDKQFSWGGSQTEEGVFEEVKYYFNSPIIHVVDSYAGFEFNKKDFLKQKFYLNIELSEPVTEEVLKKHFSIWYQKGSSEVPLLYTLDAKKTEGGKGVQTFSVKSDWVERPAEDRRIYYKISEGLSPLVGNRSLLTDYQSDFLQEKPKYVKIKGIDWEKEGSTFFAILSLNAPLNPDVLDKHLDVREGSNHPVPTELSVANSNSSGIFKYKIEGKFKPDTSYHFMISEGMLAVDGAFSASVISQASKPPKLESELRFANKGHFLSRNDLEKIPIVSTNINKFSLTIDKIYPNNVRYFLNNHKSSYGYKLGKVAKNVFHKQYDFNKKTANEEIRTHIDLKNVFRKNPHGLYWISLHRDYEYSENNRNKRWFLSTDIGLIARTFGDNVTIWADSLSTTKPLKGVRIELVDKYNQTVGKGRTDENGLVTLVALHKTDIKHVLAFKNDDFSFLDLKAHQDKLTGKNIEGLPSYFDGYRSYIYSDRGVYRPGEMAHLVSVVRDRESRGGYSVAKTSIKLKITDPKGKDILTEKYQLDESGTSVLDFQIPAEAKTGKWKAIAYHGNKAIGNYTFQVEEFVPNKIKVDLAQTTKSLLPGGTLKFKVTAKNLFGPPAAGRPVSGQVQLRATYFKPDGYSAYKFGHEKIRFQRIDADLVETRLNDDGRHSYEYQIPENIESPIGLAAFYSATVVDDGGRGVTSYKSTNVQLYSQYVGIRKLTSGVLAIDKPVAFEVVNVEKDGKKILRKDQKLEFKIFQNKLLTHYRKNERGYFRYVTEKQENLLKTMSDPRDKLNKFVYIPKKSGEYILEVRDKIGKQVSRYSFEVKGDDQDAFIQPSDNVEMKVLSARPNIGDTIQLEITSPFKGKVLLQGEREDVIFNRVVRMDSKRKIVKLKVRKDYFPNFYISATAIRPVKYGDRQNAIYSTGLINVDVIDKAQTPSITLNVPKQASPNGEMTVNFKVSDTNNANMYYTVAAVDVGILNLTRYKLPDMGDYFNQKLRLDVEHYSMYPLVMPYDPDVKYMISPSGDAPSRGLIKKKRVNPTSQRRISSVALWSGLLKTNKNGEGSVKFKLPDFNGTVKVMVVAHGNQRFASKEKPVVIKDKLVVQPALPRFLATGDSFYLPVFLYNDMGLDEDVTVTLKTTDHVQVNGAAIRSVTLPNKGKQEVGFRLNVVHLTGLAKFEVIASSPSGTTRKFINVPVRSPGTMKTESGGGVVDNMTPKTISMPKGYLEGTEEYAMKVSSNKLSRFSGSLAYLLRYPHGCLEQTTSKLFPLLYYSDIAKTLGKRSSKKSVKYYMTEGISKIERMQMEDGGFSYWEGGNSRNNWASVYASHFLVEAQKAGMKVNEAVWNNMLYHLGQSIPKDGYSEGNDYELNHYLYTLYVLSLARENVLAKLNQVYDQYQDELRPHQIARLATAFFHSEDKETAAKLMDRVDNISNYETIYRSTGGNFASNIRDLAIILDAFVQISPESPMVKQIVTQMENTSSFGRWGSTQENAYAFLAIGKALTQGTALKTKAKITLSDGTVVPFDQSAMLNTPELLKGDVRIEVEGDGEISYAWESVGIVKEPKAIQTDNGMKVRRRFLDRNGKLTDLKAIKQGDLLVAEVKVKSLGSDIQNAVVTDLLPAGLEIENSRLSTSATLPWLEKSPTVDHMDIRDDRVNFFLTVTGDEKVLYYTVRAVTKGEFKVPSIAAEAMYDPSLNSEADTLNIKIIDKK